MTKELLHPELGSGALREALALLRDHNYIYSSPTKEGQAGFYFCLCGWEGPDRSSYWKHLDALLSLSSPIEPDISPEEVAGIRQGLADVAAGRTKPIEQIRAELRERRLLENADVLATFQKYIPRLCGEIGLQTISQITGALNEALAPSRQGAGGK